MTNEEMVAEVKRLKARAERAEAALERVHREQEAAPWFVTGVSQPDTECPYRGLIDSLDALVVFVDSSGTICHANCYAAEFLEIDRSELVGMSIRTLLHRFVAPGPEHAATVDRLLSALSTQRTDEVDIVRPDGSPGCVALSQRPVHDANGNILGVVAVGTDVSARREAERERARYQKSLRSLTSELALSEERQRRRIATRIHEEISQNLAYAKLRVGSLNGCAESDYCRETVEEINDLLDNAIAGTRALAFELSPPLLHELGFAEAVEWLTEQFEDSSGIECDFVDDGQDKPIPPDVRVTLFRAVGELLRNVREHSGAERASVFLERSDGNLKVTVTDDGVGLDTDAVLRSDGLKGRFGLFNIRERLDYLAGSMEISSSPLTGTEVVLTAPLDGACNRV